MPPGESCVSSVTAGPVFEENAPKESDPSKFFSGIAARGSKAVLLECSGVAGFPCEDFLGVSCTENSVSEGNDVAKDGWKGSKAETEGCVGEDTFFSEDLLGLSCTENSVSEVNEPAKDDLPANRSMLPCNDICIEIMS